MRHSPLDLLVALEDLTPGRARHEVLHLASCADCLSTLDVLDAVGTYRAGVEPYREFAATVLTSIAAHASPVPVTGVGPSRRIRPWARLASRLDWTIAATFSLAALVAWGVLVAAHWSRSRDTLQGTSEMPSVWLAIAVGGLVALHLASHTPPLRERPVGVPS